MSVRPPTVFVVDDDASVLKGLSRLLRAAGFQAATFASPEEFLSRLDPAVPGCLVLDVAMPGLDGLELQRRLTDMDCPLPIVFLTGQGDIPMSVRAMKGGAVDFLGKPVSDDEVLAAIDEALARDRAARRERAEMAAVQARVDTLTPREREVMALVVGGRLNKQIAAELGTVEKTIKVHRARVMQKMQARSLAELVRLAELAGVEPSVPPRN